MRIVPYDLKYKSDFIEMNKAWISEMFEMEPEDERELGSIEPVSYTHLTLPTIA